MSDARIQRLIEPNQLGPASTLTVASGRIVAVRGYHLLETEGAAASDDLETIDGGVEGQQLVLAIATSGHTVVLKNAVGNLALGADVTLDSPYDSVRLLWNGSRWLKLDAADIAVPKSDKTYLYRHFDANSPSGQHLNWRFLYTPYRRESDGTVRYACYGFGPVAGTSVMHLLALFDGLPITNKWHTDGTITKTGGGWSTTTDASSPVGTIARTSVAGESISGSVTGHTLFVRAAFYTNGGYGLVSIDGDYTIAARLPAVVSGDFKNITNVVNNGSGACRVTCTSHGFANGATIIVENVAGATGANGTFPIAVIDANTFDLTGSTFGGTYTSGGTAGYFAQADLGRRYIDFQGWSTYSDEQVPLVDGLTDAAHTIAIVAKGTSRGGGNRLYVNGIAAASAGVYPDDSASTSMGYWREVFYFRGYGLTSAMVSAIECDPVDLANPSGYGSFTFVGENHGYETQSSIVYAVDAATVSLSAGQYASGYRVQITRVGQITHPATGGALANKTAVYTGQIGEIGQLRCQQTLAWVYGAKCRKAYHCMLPVGRQRVNLGGVTNDQFNAAAVGASTLSGLADNNDTQKAQLQASTIEFWHSSLHNLRVRARIDVAKNVNNWAKSAPYYAFVQDRSDQLDKGYFSRSTDVSIETVVSGDVHESDTYYRIRRE